MSTQPNILIFMTDQQRWDSLGCYGVPGVHTPNLDRLAGQGVRYDACYVNNPVCSPSRASFWTGKHLPSARNPRTGRFPSRATAAGRSCHSPAVLRRPPGSHVGRRRPCERIERADRAINAAPHPLRP